MIDFTGALGEVSLEQLREQSELETKLTDRLINAQQQKVDKTRQLLDQELDSRKGVTAEQLQLEEERSERLRQIKRKEVEEQRQLALIEITFTALVAIAKAAVAGGPLAPIAIANALTAMAAGFASARRKAIEAMPGFKGGGYTGNQGTDEVTGVVHGKEWVVDAKTTKMYRKELELLSDGKSNLLPILQYRSMIERGKDLRLSALAESFSDHGYFELLQEMREMNNHLKNQKQEIVLDANGVYYAMAEVEKNVNNARTRGRY
jgi:hypothetical protein